MGAAANLFYSHTFQSYAYQPSLLLWSDAQQDIPTFSVIERKRTANEICFQEQVAMIADNWVISAEDDPDFVESMLKIGTSEHDD